MSGFEAIRDVVKGAGNYNNWLVVWNSREGPNLPAVRLAMLILGWCG